MNVKSNKEEILVIGGLIAFTAGLATGWFANRLMTANQTVHADDILNRVKERFLEEGPIEGSWIELTKTPVKKAALETQVYYGGISRYEAEELIQYEFMADAKSGVVLDIYKL